MPRKPEVSLGLGLATAALVYSIHNGSMPINPDQRAAEAGDSHLDTCRKQSTWLAAGTVAAISLLAKDPTIFILGGLTVVALDVLDRANISTNYSIGSILPNPMTSNTKAPAPLVPNADVPNSGSYLQAVN